MMVDNPVRALIPVDEVLVLQGCIEVSSPDMPLEALIPGLRIKGHLITGIKILGKVKDNEDMCVIEFLTIPMDDPALRKVRERKHDRSADE